MILSASYLITLSALASTLGGIVRPICLAAFRLMINSNLVGCSTGKSAGLATGLLNQVGDVYLAVNDFTEFPSLVSLQKLKDVPVYVSRCSDGAEIFSIWALYGEAYDSRAP